jgi:hypothetical protein
LAGEVGLGLDLERDVGNKGEYISEMVVTGVQTAAATG